MKTVTAKSKNCPTIRHVQLNHFPMSYSMEAAFFPGGRKAITSYLEEGIQACNIELAASDSTFQVQLCISSAGDVFYAHVGSDSQTTWNRCLEKVLYGMPQWVPAYHGDHAVSYELHFAIKVDWN